MTKKEEQATIDYLKVHLAESERMWKERLPRAQIVGYLQATLESVIDHLQRVERG